MRGKYLRKIENDGQRDPTMTYMVDPSVVQVGDYLRDRFRYSRVIQIDEACFDNPHIRFAHLEDVGSLPDEAARCHDLRREDAETRRSWRRVLA